MVVGYLIDYVPKTVLAPTLRRNTSLGFVLKLYQYDQFSHSTLPVPFSFGYIRYLLKPLVTVLNDAFTTLSDGALVGGIIPSSVIFQLFDLLNNNNLS